MNYETERSFIFNEISGGKKEDRLGQSLIYLGLLVGGFAIGVLTVIGVLSN